MIKNLKLLKHIISKLLIIYASVHFAKLKIWLQIQSNIIILLYEHAGTKINNSFRNFSVS